MLVLTLEQVKYIPAAHSPRITLSFSEKPNTRNKKKYPLNIIHFDSILFSRVLFLEIKQATGELYIIEYRKHDTREVEGKPVKAWRKTLNLCGARLIDLIF